MKLKKEVRLILTMLFWGSIYLLVKSQKLDVAKTPYIMNAIYIFFIGHIAYEGIYRKNKIDSKRKEVKSRHLNELKSNLSNFTPKIATGKLPSGLTKFIPIIKKWGVDNKILREDLYENSENNELLILKSIESKRDVLEEWINENPEEQNTIKAINLTLKSYDDLGLWTWKSK